MNYIELEQEYFYREEKERVLLEISISQEIEKMKNQRKALEEREEFLQSELKRIRCELDTNKPMNPFNIQEKTQKKLA